MYSKTKYLEVFECSEVEGIIKLASEVIKQRRKYINKNLYSDPKLALKLAAIIGEFNGKLSRASDIVENGFKYIALHKSLLGILKIIVKDNFSTRYLCDLDTDFIKVEYVISVTSLKVLMASKLKEALTITNKELDPNLAPITDLEKLQVNINELNGIINTASLIPIRMSSGKHFVALDKRHAFEAKKLLQ